MVFSCQMFTFMLRGHPTGITLLCRIFLASIAYSTSAMAIDLCSAGDGQLVQLQGVRTNRLAVFTQANSPCFAPWPCLFCTAAGRSPFIVSGSMRVHRLRVRPPAWGRVLEDTRLLVCFPCGWEVPTIWTSNCPMAGFYSRTYFAQGFPLCSAKTSALNGNTSK